MAGLVFSTKDFSGSQQDFLTLNVANAALGITGRAGVQLLVDAAGQNLGKIDADGAQLVDQKNSTGTPTITSTLPTTGDQTLLAANANRRAATIYNNSDHTVFIRIGGAANASTAFSIAIPANGYWVVEANHTGAVHGLIASGTAVGNVNATEYV
jgi:hypothetical protein